MESVYPVAPWNLLCILLGGVIFRISQKLNAKIKAGSLDALPLLENPFADWSAHLFTADRTQYVIVCNTKTLYSIVMYGNTNG